MRARDFFINEVICPTTCSSVVACLSNLKFAFGDLLADNVRLMKKVPAGKISFRLSNELRQNAEAFAAADDRSLSNFIARLIAEEIKRRQSEVKSKTRKVV